MSPSLLRLSVGVLFNEDIFTSESVLLDAMPPAAWVQFFRKAGCDAHLIHIGPKSDPTRLSKLSAILNPYGEWYPELDGTQVAGAARDYVKRGGIWMEVAGHPFWYCYDTVRKERRLQGNLAGLWFNLQAVAKALPVKIEITPEAKPFMRGIKKLPTLRQFSAGLDSVYVYRGHSNPWISLVRTPSNESVLTLAKTGDGCMIAWGGNFGAAAVSTIPKVFVALLRELKGHTAQAKSRVFLQFLPATSTSSEGTALVQVKLGTLSRKPIKDVSLNLSMRGAKQVAHVEFGDLPAFGELEKSLTVNLPGGQSRRCLATLLSGAKRLGSDAITLRPDMASIEPGKKAGRWTRTVQLNPLHPRPKDFETFWQAALDESRSLLLNPKLTEVTNPAEPHRQFIAEYQGIGGVTIKGRYLVPRGVGPFPALLSLPGYGCGPVGTDQFLANKGFATLAINVHGWSIHDTDYGPDKPARAPYMLEGAESPRSHVYRTIMTNCSRAVDFLLSRKEIDGDRIACHGGSQGGGLTLATTALHKAIRVAAAYVPYLCDYSRAVRVATTGPYVELISFIKRNPSRRSSMLDVMAYFDGAHFASLIDVPTLVTIGMADTTCPPQTIYPVYHMLQGKKRLELYFEMGHSSTPGMMQRAEDWITDHLQGR